MKNANDYLSEKLQESEFKEQVAYRSYCYWRDKFLKGLTTEQVEKEIKDAMTLGYYG